MRSGPSTLLADRGEAAKLTVYFGERSRANGRLLADELLELYGRTRVHTSILLRGAEGFGAKHRLRTDRLLTLSEDLPVGAIAVDSRERIDTLAGEVVGLLGTGLAGDAGRLLGTGLATVEATRLLDDGPFDGSGETLKLTVHLGRHERADGGPAFAASCRLLREAGVAGATVLLGVDGTSNGHRRRARFFARNVHVPAMVLAVGAAPPIAKAAELLRGLLPSALLTVEPVAVCKRDGLLLATPGHETGPRQEADPGHEPAPSHETDPGQEQAGAERSSTVWQRLTVVTSEAATHGGRPIHLELIRRLRHAGAAGATSLRGIWGFHGDHEPHGDRLLSLRRHVPIVTTVIDEPSRVAGLFAIVDELTRERGLVTSETLPANMALSARL